MESQDPAAVYVDPQSTPVGNIQGSTSWQVGMQLQQQLNRLQKQDMEMRLQQLHQRQQRHQQQMHQLTQTHQQTFRQQQGAVGHAIPLQHLEAQLLSSPHAGVDEAATFEDRYHQQHPHHRPQNEWRL